MSPIQDQVTHATESAITRFGRVDVVVNNAGYGLVGALEGMTDAQLRDQMETNFFGALSVTRAFLPHFRAQGGGRFIHISSVAGFTVGAGGAIYSASKFALEGLSEGIAREGKDLGILSTCVEPGPFRTDWAGRSLQLSEQSISAYDSTVSALTDRLAKVNGKQKGDPAKAAAAIEHIATLPDPPLRLPLGEMAYQTYVRRLDEIRAEFERFADLTRSADFPE